MGKWGGGGGLKSRDTIPLTRASRQYFQTQRVFVASSTYLLMYCTVRDQT